jgi:hypothetical protein
MGVDGETPISLRIAGRNAEGKEKKTLQEKHTKAVK